MHPHAYLEESRNKGCERGENREKRELERRVQSHGLKKRRNLSIIISSEKGGYKTSVRVTGTVSILLSLRSL